MNINENVIACIPSKTMRKFLSSNPIEMSALQQATIVCNYAKKKNRLILFRQLLEETNDEAEKLFLSSTIKDVQDGVEYYSDDTRGIYYEKFPHEGFPCFPFLEICGLPVLFEEGDVIRWHGRGSTLYYVGGLPLLIPEHCDFTDECYLSYSLSYPVEDDHDLLLVHEHINLCEAEQGSIRKLTPQQKNIYHRVRTILSMMKKGFNHE